MPINPEWMPKGVLAKRFNGWVSAAPMSPSKPAGSENPAGRSKGPPSPHIPRVGDPWLLVARSFRAGSPAPPSPNRSKNLCIHPQIFFRTLHFTKTCLEFPPLYPDLSPTQPQCPEFPITLPATRPQSRRDFVLSARGFTPGSSPTISHFHTIAYCPLPIAHLKIEPDRFRPSDGSTDA